MNAEPLTPSSDNGSTRTSRTPRLDKSHGFLQAIIRNQVDRAAYHDFVSERRRKKSEEVKADHAKKMQTANLYVPPHLRKHYAEQMPTRNASPEESSSSEDDARTSSRSSSEHSSPDKKIEEMKRAARLRIEREHSATAAKSSVEPPQSSVARLECNVMELLEREDGPISAEMATMSSTKYQQVKPNTAEDTSIDDIAQALGSFTLTSSEAVSTDSRE